MMDYKKARKQLKKIKTLLDSFESLGEPISEMEARLLRKYADEFKKIIPHAEQEEIVSSQPAVESAIINLKGDIQEKTLPKVSADVSEEFDVAPEVEEIAPVEEVAEIIEEPKVEEIVEEVAEVAPEVSIKTNVIEPAVAEVKTTVAEKVEPAKKADKKRVLVAEHDMEELESISLWEPVQITELSQKLSFSPIKNVFKAISINERIFTQNELFNGDHVLFKDTLDHIETLGSFEEASAYLKNGVASDNNWIDAKKIKKAKEFMRLVQRRFI